MRIGGVTPHVRESVFSIGVPRLGARAPPPPEQNSGGAKVSAKIFPLAPPALANVFTSIFSVFTGLEYQH